MKIALVGGGTGGHFYPLIAVTESIRKMTREKRLVDPSVYYIAPSPFDKDVLYDNDITHIYCTAGKIRIEKGIVSVIKNTVDILKIIFGVLQAFFILIRIYPDVIFSKGGYAAFPILFIAKLFRIPVVIHDSDAIPGRVTLWSAKFAEKIAISFPEAETYFSSKDKRKLALTGIPIRSRLTQKPVLEAKSKLDLDPNRPLLFIIGGSSGSQFINSTILDVLPKLVQDYQVIHQTGKSLYKDVMLITHSLLKKSLFKDRYRIFPTLNLYFMHLAYSAADIVITRAGGSVIFEIAQYGKPSILIPIPKNISRDQHENAYAYARAGGGVVIEQNTLTSGVFLAEIEKLIKNKELAEEKSNLARQFTRPAASKTIAESLLKIVAKHA